MLGVFCCVKFLEDKFVDYSVEISAFVAFELLCCNVIMLCCKSWNRCFQ